MKKKLPRDYSIFALASIVVVMVAMMILIYLSFKDSVAESSDNLNKAAKELEIAICNSFDYTNQINSHLGLQIAQHGAKDLKFILHLFQETDKINYRNLQLFSWSSFDWVDEKNLQQVNGRIGIRKNPPDMSQREYTKTAPYKPWTLQLSSPALGNPSKSWIIPAGTGVVDKNGKYLGAISLGFNIVEFENHLKQRINPDVSFVVVDRQGHLILKSSDISLGRDSDFFAINLEVEDLVQSAGNLPKNIVVGNVILSNYALSSAYPYIILTGFDRSFLNHKFVISLLPKILEFVCITVFFLIILYLLRTRIFLLEKERALRISLERLDRAKDKILSSIAHDIKNQIYGIHGLSRIILESKTKQQICSSEDLQMVETIADQADDMMEFVKDLLDENQLESGEFNLGKMKNCQVQALISEAILITNGLALRQEVTLRTEIDPALPTLLCSPRRIKQILVNLITNAVKYSDVRKEVVIEAKYLPEKQQIMITVCDQGVGMSPEEIKMIFAGRGRDIAKSKFGVIDSHGIGMQIVLHLVKLHNGTIEIRSQKGAGTRVEIYFDTKQLVQATEEKSVIAHNKSIILAEDNPTNIKITTKVLHDLGYRVRGAENGRDVLKLLEEEDSDLILMDGEMPVMNGYEAAKLIREGECFARFRNYKNIPIVALMSSSDEQTIKRAIDSGMNLHIEKSTSKTKLMSVLSEILKD